MPKKRTARAPQKKTHALVTEKEIILDGSCEDNEVYSWHGWRRGLLGRSRCRRFFQLPMHLFGHFQQHFVTRLKIQACLYCIQRSPLSTNQAVCGLNFAKTMTITYVCRKYEQECQVQKRKAKELSMRVQSQHEKLAPETNGLIGFKILSNAPRFIATAAK